MDINCAHENIYFCGKREYYFFTWSIPNISSISNVNIVSKEYKMKNGLPYKGYLNGSKDIITFGIQSTSQYLKCFASIFIGSETLLLSNTLNKPTSSGELPRYANEVHIPQQHYYTLITLSSGDENFEKLKQNPNDTSVLICRIIYYENSTFSSVAEKTPGNTSTNKLYNLKMFIAALKTSSVSLSKEKVILQVGEETESVSKAVLCARSPVFAKMFENDMRELHDKTVTITDIKMPVLKVLVYFLYTGMLSNLESNGEVDFLCDLYYAANKYDIPQLRQSCVHLLLPQISMENMNQIMKLAFTHNDELLKSTILALIATNIETWFSTDDWINLINDEPNIANEVFNFLDL